MLSFIQRLVLAVIVTMIALPVWAQPTDSVQSRRNVIKYHLGSLALFPQSLVLSYERVTQPNQSFTVMAGYTPFPNLRRIGTAIEVKDNISKNGLTLGGEYRFYLKKENKYLAPHGVFIGPYANMYQFWNDRSLAITSPDGASTSQIFLTSDLNIANVGFEMGYQFVFNDRWTVETVFFGPSLSRYSLDLKLDGNYDLEEDILEDEILAALLDNFPLIKELLTDKELKLQGRTNTWAAGFRYQLNLGYRFGK